MRLYKRGKKQVWQVEFWHEGKRYNRSTKAASKYIATKTAAEMLARVERGDPIDEQEDQPVSDELADLIDEYEDELNRRGRKKKTVYECVMTLSRGILDAEIETLNELTPKSIVRSLSYFADRSPRTQNCALGHFKAWCSWMERTGRNDCNPAKSIERVKEHRVKEPRRALNDEEFWLLTESDLVPECRQVVYLLAAHTGLRRRELGSIQWGDVDLEREEITIQGRNAKNGKTVTLPVPESTVERWRAWLEEPVARFCEDEYLHESSPIPPVPSCHTFRNDLGYLGIPITTNEGRLDFHSLRVTFGSLLARNGVSLALAQKLMRHSTPVLTANVYTRFAPSDKRAAVELLSKKKPQRRRDERAG